MAFYIEEEDEEIVQETNSEFLSLKRHQNNHRAF